MSETPTHKKRQVTFEKDDSSDDSVQVIETEPTHKPTPSTAARAIVVEVVASHPEPIKDLLLLMSHSFNVQRSKLRQQEQTLLKLAEESYVPRSARSNFKLNASESVMESAEYQTLAATMETACNTWKDAAKKTIVSVAKLEIKHTQKNIANLFISTAWQIAKLLLLKADPETDLSEILLAALALETHGTTLIKYSCLKLPEALTALFHPQVFSGIILSTEMKNRLTPFVADFNTLMKAAFVASWDAQLTVYQNQASERAMSKQVQEFLNGTATQQAAAVMDTEPTADPALLKDIVKRQVDSQQKQLQQQINQLKQLVNRSLNQADKTPKNKPRGATNNQNRAPSTKKQPPATPLKSALKKPNQQKNKPSPKKPSPKQPDASAGRQGNGSPPSGVRIKLFRKASPERGRPIKHKNSKKPPSRK